MFLVLLSSLEFVELESSSEAMVWLICFLLELESASLEFVELESSEALLWLVGIWLLFFSGVVLFSSGVVLFFSGVVLFFSGVVLLFFWLLFFGLKPISSTGTPGTDIAMASSPRDRNNP